MHSSVLEVLLGEAVQIEDKVSLKKHVQIQKMISETGEVTDVTHRQSSSTTCSQRSCH